MIRRQIGFFRGRAALLAVAAAATLPLPAAAQLARPRTAAPDAPKLLVLPFVREGADSALSLVVADGVRDRLRTAHLDKFNTIPRSNLCENLTQSGFPCDVPLEPSVVRQLLRFMNTKYAIEGSMIRRGDSMLVVSRLYEASGAHPQAYSMSVMAPMSRVGGGTGGEIANRLVDGFRSFDEVAECWRRVDAQNLAGAMQKAQEALHQSPNNAGAYLCIATVIERQNGPVDSIIAALHSAYERDTLNTQTMRSLATRYQAKNDTANLVDMLKRILTIDFRDNDLRISTIRLLVSMNQLDSAIALANQGLRENPASAELLYVKGLGMAAGRHMDSAFNLLETVASIDTSKVDSLFMFRIVNYARAIPDSAAWLRWVERGTQRFPTQLDYWYTLGSVRMVRGDSAGAETAARGLLTNAPPNACASDNATIKSYCARAHYLLAMMAQGHGQLDSALAHADIAVQSDTTIKSAVAVVYLLAGARERAASATDTANGQGAVHLTKSIELLTRARDYGAANQGLMRNAAFQLGVAQFTLGRQLDQKAESNRDCAAVAQLGPIWQGVSDNITAGARVNVDIANQILTAVPQFQSRADAFRRNFRCQ